MADEKITLELTAEDVAKLVDLKAEQVKAENDRNTAEAEKARAEARKAEAEARKAEIEARKSEIGLDREAEKRSEELAHDSYSRIYTFSESVSGSSVEKAIEKLSVWSRLSLEEDDQPCDLEIVLMSPGGSVVAGMAFFDFIQSLRRKGHKVITRARGYAASMAGILLQAGEVRIMERECWLLIHRGSGSATGSMGDIEDTVEWFKKIDERVLNIFYDRSRGGERPFTKNMLRKKFDRKDWWLSSEDALRHGFCDEVA